MIKNPPAIQKTWVRSLDQEDSQEKETEIHSSTLVWKFSWIEEPGEQQSIGSKKSQT